MKGKIQTASVTCWDNGRNKDIFGWRVVIDGVDYYTEDKTPTGKMLIANSIPFDEENPVPSNLRNHLVGKEVEFTHTKRQKLVITKVL